MTRLLIKFVIQYHSRPGYKGQCLRRALSRGANYVFCERWLVTIWVSGHAEKRAGSFWHFVVATLDCISLTHHLLGTIAISRSTMAIWVKDMLSKKHLDILKPSSAAHLGLDNNSWSLDRDMQLILSCHNSPLLHVGAEFARVRSKGSNSVKLKELSPLWRRLSSAHPSAWCLVNVVVKIYTIIWHFGVFISSRFVVID